MLSKNLFLFLFLSMFLIASCAKKVNKKEVPPAAAEESKEKPKPPAEAPPGVKNAVTTSIPDDLLGIWEGSIEQTKPGELVFIREASVKCEKDCLSLSIAKTATTLTIKFATNLKDNQEFYPMTNASVTCKDGILTILITNISVAYDKETKTVSFTDSLAINFNTDNKIPANANIKAILSDDKKSLTVKDQVSIDILYSYIGLINSFNVDPANAQPQVKAKESTFEESDLLNSNTKITGDLLGEISESNDGYKHIIKSTLKKWDANAKHTPNTYLDANKDYIYLTFSSATNDNIDKEFNIFKVKDKKVAKKLEDSIIISFSDNNKVYGYAKTYDNDDVDYKGTINKINEKKEVMEMEIEIYISNDVYDKTLQ